METRLLHTLPAALIAALLFGCSTTEPTEPSEEPEAQPPQTTAPEVQLHGYSVHRVRLDHPHRIRTQDGREEEFREAYLVRLEMTLPPPSGPVLELYVGEERIREYGGWKGGLYFKVYDAARLARLDGGELSWRWHLKERTSSGRRMELESPQDLPLEAEAGVIGR